MSCNSIYVAWSSQRSSKQGRPLTKKVNQTTCVNRHPEHVAQSTADEYATFQYGASHVGSEEEWITLEKEIFSLCLEPLDKTTSSFENSFKESQKLISFNGAQCQQTRKFCQFCAKNGELRNVVESHNLRHPVSRIVQCPILRRYKCELCGATGDDAHTKFYCPLNPSRPSAPTAVLLKNTRNNASGRRS